MSILTGPNPAKRRKKRGNLCTSSTNLFSLAILLAHRSARHQSLPYANDTPTFSNALARRRLLQSLSQLKKQVAKGTLKSVLRFGMTGKISRRNETGVYKLCGKLSGILQIRRGKTRKTLFWKTDSAHVARNAPAGISQSQTCRGEFE
jgi:hypothetical protein